MKVKRVKFCDECKYINHNGYCYRLPPAVQVMTYPAGQQLETHRPYVLGDEACGEFNEREKHAESDI